MITTIKKLREHLQLEQKQLGQLLGVSEGYVCHLENGRRKLTLKILQKLLLLARDRNIRIDLNKWVEESM